MRAVSSQAVSVQPVPDGGRASVQDLRHVADRELAADDLARAGRARWARARRGAPRATRSGRAYGPSTRRWRGRGLPRVRSSRSTLRPPIAPPTSRAPPIRTLVRTSDGSVQPDAPPVDLAPRDQPLRQTAVDAAPRRPHAGDEPAGGPSAREVLDQLRRPGGRVVRAPPCGQLARALAYLRLGQRALAPPGAPDRARTSRRGTRTPTPAQSMRAAFSFMSPAAGTTTTAQPLASARATRPVPAVADDDVAARHRPRVGEPVDQARVLPARRWVRPAAGGSRSPSTRTGGAARARRSAARSSWCVGSCDVDGATSTSGSSPGGSSTSSDGGSHSSGPTTCVAGQRGRARVLELRERRRRAPARARSRRARRASGAQARAAARVSLSSLAPALEPAPISRSTPAPQRPAGRRARAAARPIEYGGQPRSARGSTCGMSVATGTPSSSAASAGASVRMSATTDVGRERRHERPRLPRRAHHRLVGLQRPLERGEDVVLRRRRERACPSALDVVLPALPRLQRHLVPARAQRAPERDDRERVARVAEGAQEQPQRTRQAAGKLRDQPQLLEALLLRPRHRRDAQRPDAGVAVGAQPLAHVVGRARRARPCRSARRAAPPSPRRACPPGRGPGPRAAASSKP